MTLTQALAHRNIWARPQENLKNVIFAIAATPASEQRALQHRQNFLAFLNFSISQHQANLANRFRGRSKRQNQSRMKKNLILKNKQRFKRRCEFDFNRAFGMPYDELRGIYVFSYPKNATRSS